MNKKSKLVFKKPKKRKNVVKLLSKINFVKSNKSAYDGIKFNPVMFDEIGLWHD